MVAQFSTLRLMPPSPIQTTRPNVGLPILSPCGVQAVPPTGARGLTPRSTRRGTAGCAALRARVNATFGQTRSARRGYEHSQVKGLDSADQYRDPHRGPGYARYSAPRRGGAAGEEGAQSRVSERVFRGERNIGGRSLSARTARARLCRGTEHRDRILILSSFH